MKNTHNGFVNRKGTIIGFYRTKGQARKRWIQDYYVDYYDNLVSSNPHIVRKNCKKKTTDKNYR